MYEKQTNGILGNCIQGIYFGPGEAETVECILDSLGEYRETVTNRTRSRSRESHSSSTTREENRAPITSGELQDMDSGEGWWRAGRSGGSGSGEASFESIVHAKKPWRPIVPKAWPNSSGKASVA